MAEHQVLFVNKEEDFYVDAVPCAGCGEPVAVFQRGGYPGEWAQIAVLCAACFPFDGRITEEEAERILPDDL